MTRMHRAALQPSGKPLAGRPFLPPWGRNAWSGPQTVCAPYLLSEAPAPPRASSPHLARSFLPARLPASKYTFIVQGESGASYESLHGFNTGLMYVRGAAPGGPTAWLLAETVLR